MEEMVGQVAAAIDAGDLPRARSLAAGFAVVRRARPGVPGGAPGTSAGGPAMAPPGLADAAESIAQVGYRLADDESGGYSVFGAFAVAAGLRDEAGDLWPAGRVSGDLAARVRQPSDKMRARLAKLGVAPEQLTNLADVIAAQDTWARDGLLIPELLARVHRVSLEYFDYYPGREPDSWEELGKRGRTPVSMVRVRTDDGGEYWAAALPLTAPGSERAGSLFSESDEDGEDMSVDSPGEYGAGDRAES
ncbi:hypothetical protein, partial [Streptomyces violaceorubidus]|uniref:hypothetical protein n=1 Tax=Streptomyces violaceorubidus TaxID=284042 RepID=UPI001ADFB099